MGPPLTEVDVDRRALSPALGQMNGLKLRAVSDRQVQIGPAGGEVECGQCAAADDVEGVQARFSDREVLGMTADEESAALGVEIEGGKAGPTGLR